MDSLIFDLDGTLWDSRETVATAWNAVIQKNNLQEEPLTIEDLKATMGLQMKDIMKKLFPHYSEDVQDQLIRDCGEMEGSYLSKSGGVLYKNLESVLHRLSQHYKLFIVSNCQEGYIEAFLDFHQLGGYFLDFENPGRTGLSKGENIELLMKRNRLKAPVYIGDTAGDQEAAKQAGIPFIYAKYGFGEVDGADYSIEDVGDLLALFDHE